MFNGLFSGKTTNAGGGNEGKGEARLKKTIAREGRVISALPVVLLDDASCLPTHFWQCEGWGGCGFSAHPGTIPCGPCFLGANDFTQTRARGNGAAGIAGCIQAVVARRSRYGRERGGRFPLPMPKRSSIPSGRW